MSALNDGRFVFTDKKGYLYIESKVENNNFSLLYGSRTVAYAFNAEMSFVALVCPLNDAALESSPTNNDPSQSVLKVYRFEDDSLTELLDEMQTPLASSVLWVNSAYLVVSNPDNLTSVIKFLKGKLKMDVRDKGLYPFVSFNLLGLLSMEPSFLHLWDVDRNKKVDSIALKTKHGRGKRKVIHGSCGSGNFAVLAYGDNTASVLYIAGRSARLFSTSSPISLSTTRKNQPSESEAERVRINPLCSALSSSAVLVGLSGGREILRIKYNRDKGFTVEDHKKLGNGEELAGISKNRYLVQKVDEGDGKTITFTAHPLPTTRSASSAKVEDSQAGAPEAPAGVGPTDTGLGESAKKKKRRRNRKEKSILEDQTPNEPERRNITGENYSVYGTRVAIGMLFIGILMAIYLRRR